VREYDHWIAFSLLFAIGIKMIIESLRDEEEKKEIDPFNPVVLISMAIATSIDAFVVGISFAFLDINIYFSMGVILSTTYIVAMLGMLFG
jgi:putative Mn2+ efflux pump MntP